MIRENNFENGIPFYIHPDILEKLDIDQTPFARNSVLPVTNHEDLNFLETVAVDRYTDLTKQFKRTLNIENFVPQHIISNASQSAMVIDHMESEHREQLAELAIKYVKRDFNIHDDEIGFDVTITGVGGVELPENMNFKPEEEEEDEISPQFKFEMDGEIQKRRFINALSAGASKKGHYIFHLATDEINSINDNLMEHYQIMMSANDFMYYLLPDQFAQMAVEGEDNNSNAGFMRINWDGEFPVVEVNAVNFPTAIHEIIKGIMEVISYIAFPDGKDEQQYMIDQADHLLGEMWDIRLGPVFWERFHSAIPSGELINKKHILAKLYALETEEFLNTFKEIIKPDGVGKEIIERIVRGVNADLNN